MRLHVVAAVIGDGDGRVLVQQRAAHRHLGGLWEFPGGKVEAGEMPSAALARELDEELGISIRTPHPWMTVDHAYEDRTVFLDVWRVAVWDGEVIPREDQPLRWLGPAGLAAHPMPAADRPVVSALLAESGD